MDKSEDEYKKKLLGMEQKQTNKKKDEKTQSCYFLFWS